MVVPPLITFLGLLWTWKSYEASQKLLVVGKLETELYIYCNTRLNLQNIQYTDVYSMFTLPFRKVFWGSFSHFLFGNVAFKTSGEPRLAQVFRVFTRQEVLKRRKRRERRLKAKMRKRPGGRGERGKNTKETKTKHEKTQFFFVFFCWTGGCFVFPCECFWKGCFCMFEIWLEGSGLVVIMFVLHETGMTSKLRR